MKIPYSLKKQCADLANSGQSYHKIYAEIFSTVHPEMGYETFRHKLRMWKSKIFATAETLEAGTYKGFTPHDATVQVNGNGEITQAWIKQKINDIDFEQLCEVIRESVLPTKITCATDASDKMLEIPLFDMHFPIGTYEYYKPTQVEILGVIRSKTWNEINIIIGQDLIHNNDMNGHTKNGTNIEKVDIPTAWKYCRKFWLPIIDESIKSSGKLKITYSKGNHDECMAWCFVQELKARYPQAEFDDSLKERKAIYWNGCFIGIGHCEYSNKADRLFEEFVCDFPMEFATAKVREIHSGHLHRESIDNGIMVRRLASGVPTDKWSDDNGFNTAHKRFQIFEWEPNRLKAIYYV